MSVSFGCRCAERRKQVQKRNWGVIQRLCNQSAFNGYRTTFSDYSTVHCLSCGSVGRTKADYVANLPSLHPYGGMWHFSTRCSGCGRTFYTKERTDEKCERCAQNAALPAPVPVHYLDWAKVLGAHFEYRTLEGAFQVYGEGLKHVCMCDSEKVAAFVTTALDSYAYEREKQKIAKTV